MVTNPAIDREREVEHFSTRTILGRRPDKDHGPDSVALGLVLQTPILLDCAAQAFLDPEEEAALRRNWGVAALEAVQDFFTAHGRDMERSVTLEASFAPNEERLEKRL